VRPVGEAAYTVEFGDIVASDLNHRVHALDAHLQTMAVDGIVETVPTYRSLLVIFDPRRVGADGLKGQLHAWAVATRTASGNGREDTVGRLTEVPVHYGGEDGPDLAAVAARSGLDPDAVVDRHASVVYQVAMLGFAPGFAYLLGLPPELTTPRLETPRLHVPPGSVGIAGEQTGIYALGTPGGWRIIGRTRLSLFDPRREDPFLIEAGDRVRFVPT
jgi:KipI family sensor histidine kinase inhibitor